MQYTHAQELPTEPGWYLGQQGVIFHRDTTGWTSPNIHPDPEPDIVRFWEPITRLYTQAEVDALRRQTIDDVFQHVADLLPKEADVLLARARLHLSQDA